MTGCCYDCYDDPQANAACWEAEHRALVLQRAIDRDSRLTLAEWDAKIRADHERCGDSSLAKAARMWHNDALTRLRPPPLHLAPALAGTDQFGRWTAAAEAAEQARADRRTAAWLGRHQ